MVTLPARATTWWRKTTCVFCARHIRMTHALRNQQLIVCRRCYRNWEDEGRRCAACQTPVAGPQNVGAFLKPRPALGHVDCGGVLLTW